MQTQIPAQAQTIAPRLERPLRGRDLGGVCAGLARYFRVDVALVRILFIVFTFAGGAAVPVYLALWLLIPPEGGSAVLPGLQTAGPTAGEFIGALLVIAGALWLLGNFGAFAFVRWEIVWPIVLVGLGVLLLVKGDRR